MNHKRRDMMRITSVLSLAISAGLLKTSAAFAADWNAKAFEAKNMEEVVKALGGSAPTISKDIMITAPDIAENGAVVPVSVSSSVPKTQYMAILVEKNPSALSAGFNIPADSEPSVSTRIKMGSTSKVHALVKADGKWLIATKEIKVTLGGCGG